MNKKIITIIVILLLVLVLAWWAKPISNKYLSCDRNITGKITAGPDQQNTYSNKTLGFSFTYPSSFWQVDANCLDYHYGIGGLQLFNYDDSGPPRPFKRTGWNKIEFSMIGTNIIAPPQADADYVETSQIAKEINIAGKTVTRVDIEFLGGTRMAQNIIQFPNDSRHFLDISIYGDPANFNVIDQIVASLTWDK